MVIITEPVSLWLGVDRGAAGAGTLLHPLRWHHRDAGVEHSREPSGA